MRQVHHRLAALALALTLCGPVSGAVEGIIGGETGDMSELDGGTGAVTATARSGAYAFYNSSGGSSRLIKNGTDADIYVVRFGFYITSNPASEFEFAVIETSAGTPLSRIYMNTSRQLRVQAAGGTIQTGTTALSTGTWYTVEFSYVIGTGSDAVAQVRLNETLEATSNNGTQTSQAGRIALSAASTTRFYDDLRFDSMSGSVTWIGAGRINAMRPNAAGDETGATGTFADIDDDPINDSTGRTESSGPAFLDNLTATSTFDETPDTINYSHIAVRASRSNGAGRSHFIRSKKSGVSAENSGDLLLDGTVRYYEWVPTTAPASAAELDAWQAGMSQSASGGRQYTVTEIWLMVDYTPATASPSGQSPQFFITAH